MKSHLVILDANVIIEAHRGGFWNALVTSYNVHVCSTVINVEVTHYRDANNNKIDIDLRPAVAANQINEITADVEDLKALDQKINPSMRGLIDAGEKEVIALMIKGEFEEHLFCTGDTRAIKVISALGMGSLAVSLEELLEKIGQKGKLPNPSYSKSKFDKCKAEGIVEQNIIMKK